jgi:hypothetical protein
MTRFIEGVDRRQGALLPEHLDDYVSEENPGGNQTYAGLRLSRCTKLVPATPPCRFTSCSWPRSLSVSRRSRPRGELCH